MADKVGVVIGYYGGAEWESLAERARDSVLHQTRLPDVVITALADTLHEARNSGAEALDACDWIIFLDADDELDSRYIESMLAATGDIRRPATLGVYEDGTEDDEPHLIPKRDLRTANYIVIGAMCRASLFFEVGGFRPYPILEDWDLWRRMYSTGAIITDVPDAVYRVHVRPGSRNTDAVLHSRIYREIVSQPI